MEQVFRAAPRRCRTPTLSSDLRRAAAGWPLAVFLVAAAANAGAQTVPLTLEQSQRLARERSPQLAGLDAGAAAARDMAVAAQQRPDPVFKLGLDNLPVDGADRYRVTRDFMTMRRIGWMQEMPRAEKLELRGERFRIEGRRVLAERAAAAAEIDRDAALAWIEVAYAERALSLERTVAEALAKEVEAAEIAYAAARGTQADVHAARSARLKRLDRLLDTERRVSAARALLGRWVGPELAAAPLAPAPDWTDVPESYESDDQTRHPALRVYALQESGASTEEKLAAANRVPDWSWEVSYQQRGPNYSNMVSFGVSIPVPWDRPQRQDREAAARRALLDQVRQQREDALRAQSARLLAARAAYRSAGERRAQIAPLLLEAAAQRTSAQQLAYRSGAGKLSDVLASRRDEFEARLMTLDIEADQARAWAELRYLAARAPQELDAGEGDKR